MTHTDLVKYGYPLNIAENYIDLFDDYRHNLDIDIDRFKDMNDDQLKAIDEITKRFSNKGRKIFFMRFKELKTGDEIKETTGVYTSSSHKICKRMLKYICSTECLDIIYTVSPTLQGNLNNNSCSSNSSYCASLSIVFVSKLH